MEQKQPKHQVVKEFIKDKALAQLFDSAIDHIGKMLDNLKFSEIPEAIAYIMLAKLGYDKLPEALPWELRISWGIVGLKLAQTSGGGGDISFKIGGTGFSLPANSQIAGLCMLASLGFASVPWADTPLGPLIEQRNKEAKAGRDIAQTNKDVQAALINPNVTDADKEQLKALQLELMKWAIGGIYAVNVPEITNNQIKYMGLIYVILDKYNVGTENTNVQEPDIIPGWFTNGSGAGAR